MLYRNVSRWLRSSSCVATISANAVVAVVAVLWTSITSNLAAADHPNVVVILSDDQGWGDLSLNGNTNLSTPNIDSLAKNGVTFDRFYVCPVCSPTRAEFLTGRYHPHSNVYSTSAGGERMDLDEVTIADTFKAAGYATGAFGKWHNGMQYPYHPNGRGFDEFYGFCSGHWAEYYSPQLEHNGRLVKGDGFVIDDFTNHAIEFIRKQTAAEKPFFAYLPYNTPHSPMQVPDEFWNRFKDKDLAMRHRGPRNSVEKKNGTKGTGKGNGTAKGKPKRKIGNKEDVLFTKAALAMCENIDWNVGRIVEELRRLEILDNTIVIYFADNGPNSNRWNGDMKGRKGSTDEGGVRSPLVVHWPGKVVAGARVTELGAAIDLLPTLADLADVELISDKPIEGLSLKPHLVNDPKSAVAIPWPDRTIFSHWNKKVSTRNKRFRLDHVGKLFDIQNDPGQRTPVNAQFPDIAEKLKQQAAVWESTTVAEIDRTPQPFLLGHSSYRYTQLPARDGTASGEIKRSNRFPNCSYFLNWTSTEEEVTWPVKVAAAGKYHVEMWYACKQENVGVELELSIGDVKTSAVVTEPHDPPLLGEQNDRYPRAEGFIKNFKPMLLGTVQLKPGESTLKLRATKIPGPKAIEFRLLMFYRK